MKKVLIKLAVIAIAASSMLVLSSCSKKPNASDNSGSGSDGSQTYGMNSGNTDSDGFKINSMKAPSNQTYYFALNSSDMRPQDMTALTNQANYLASHATAHIRLEGNTDNRGSREYNIGLGWHRDQTVARILEQQGVRANQIQMVSYGKENPAVPGNNEHAWALNRRVDFVYK
ncbi:MAG: OmpA family protein [Gammaproteobacteria bacterium]|nr:OmpA family protein [Gammaproteobacteria bacterium]